MFFYQVFFDILKASAKCVKNFICAKVEVLFRFCFQMETTAELSSMMYQRCLHINMWSLSTLNSPFYKYAPRCCHHDNYILMYHIAAILFLCIMTSSFSHYNAALFFYQLPHVVLTRAFV